MLQSFQACWRERQCELHLNLEIGHRNDSKQWYRTKQMWDPTMWEMFCRNRKHLRSSKEPFYSLERNESEISPSPQPQIATSASCQESCATEFHLQEPSTETVQHDKSSKPEVVESDKPQPGQHRITRGGRVSKPPSYLTDYAWKLRFISWEDCFWKQVNFQR